jgi:hypothetical protein
MMDNQFAHSALQNTELYITIINHRQKFNHIQGIDYQKYYKGQIQICPPEKLRNDWKNDYNKLLVSFIYDKSQKTFDELLSRMLELTNRVKLMAANEETN